MLGVSGIATALAGAYPLSFDKVSLELGVFIIAGGFVNELLWLGIARRHQNALKCIACGDIQPLSSPGDYDDTEAFIEEAAPVRKPKRRKRRKQRAGKGH